MTTPDPRTDLAGYLDLTDDQAEDCRRSAPFHPGSVYTKIGARLIEQDQARAAEPDDGLHAMLDIDALGGAKHLRETMCVAQGAVLREGHPGAWLHADRISSIIDVCDQHRPLGPDGKHGTRRCTPTCGCIDKRDPEPDDGLIPVTAEQIEAFRAAWLKADGEGRSGQRVRAGLEAVFAIDLPAPKPPWKSPLDDLPDLTEEQCDYLAKLAAGYSDDDNDSVLVLVGRALIAAGWTPEEEA